MKYAGLFMALERGIIACGTKRAVMGMGIRFMCGPLLMAAASIAVGLRGPILRTAIVQVYITTTYFTTFFSLSMRFSPPQNQWMSYIYYVKISFWSSNHSENSILILNVFLFCFSYWTFSFILPLVRNIIMSSNLFLLSLSWNLIGKERKIFIILEWKINYKFINIYINF